MSNIVDASGRRAIAAPPPESPAGFYHECAVAAARACDDETKGSAELAVLAEVAQQAALMRDLLTIRRPGRFSSNDTFGYALVGQVSPGQVRAALLWLADGHDARAASFEAALGAQSGAQAGPRRDARVLSREAAQNARGRARILRTWAGLHGAAGRYEPGPAALLFTTLVLNLLQAIAQANNPSMLGMAMWLAAEAQLVAAGGAPAGRRWVQDAPDHWSSVERGLPTLSAWPSRLVGADGYRWEVWRPDVAPRDDDPVASGAAYDLAAAQSAAEAEAERLFPRPAADRPDPDGLPG